MYVLHLVALLIFALASLVPIRGEAALTQDSVLDEIDAIQNRVSTVRDLKPTGPISRDLMGRDDLRAYLENSFLEDVTPEEIESNQYRWEILGYIDPGYDLIHAYLEVLTEQVLGFYAIDKKTLYLISEQEHLTASDVLTISHELTHALQDQHFDLKANFNARETENDQIMAYQALTEGDAVLSSLLYGRQYMSTAQLFDAFQSESAGGSSVLDTAPLVIRRELLFPYTAGVDFVADRYADGQWDAVNRVWENPPQSTEQVLHPAKYAAGEGPIAVSVPDMAARLGPEWRELEENTQGELDWQILIEQFADAPTGAEAAAGWGGDRFRLLRRDADGALIFAARTAWDSDPDARQFFEAYQRVTRGRHGASLQTSPERTVRTTAELAQRGDRWEAQAGAYSYAMELDGSRVNLVISTGPAAAGVLDTMATQ
jgi:hypothetical protein